MPPCPTLRVDTLLYFFNIVLTISCDCFHMLLLAAASAVEHNDNRCARISDLCGSISPLFCSTAAETQQVASTIPSQKTHRSKTCVYVSNWRLEMEGIWLQTDNHITAWEQETDAADTSNPTSCLCLSYVFISSGLTQTRPACFLQVFSLATPEAWFWLGSGLGLLPFQSLQKVSHVCQEQKGLPFLVVAVSSLLLYFLPPLDDPWASGCEEAYVEGFCDRDFGLIQIPLFHHHPLWFLHFKGRWMFTSCWATEDIKTDLNLSDFFSASQW